MGEKTESKPLTLYGVSASPGVAVGSIWLVSHRDLEIPSERIDEGQAASHMEKANQILSRVEQQLYKLQQTQHDQEVREILDAQVAIIKDPELYKRVEHLILQENRSSEYALYMAFNEYIQLLSQTGREWIKDRIVDLQSLRNRLVHQSSGSNSDQKLAAGTVVFADELSPTEVIEFSESGIAAIVMRHGGKTSHAAIIAQALDIPCVVGVEWRRTEIERFMEAAVDATSGEVVLNPDRETVDRYRLRKKQIDTIHRELLEISRKPDETACGKPFQLQANIEFEEELKRLDAYQARGVGLLRTETLFLRQGYFDQNRHEDFYRQVLIRTGEDMVTIRLLDIGGDKLPGKKFDEPNPFLGWRGVRMLLDEKELLVKQLESIFRVATDAPGRVRILVPMVSDPGELIEIRARIDQVREDMTARGESPGVPLPVGIMIEVPAIALLADEAAKTADFFSIGSNDLTQYVLAADRGNERVSRLYSSAHPAVWKLIENAAQAAKRAAIPISVCGEMAGNPILAAALLGMGVRELSMNPASIPLVKKLICSYDLDTFQELFDNLIHASGREEAENVINTWQQQKMEKL